MTKSSNTQGNPYHDEEGKFTSPDAATLGISVDDFLSYKKGSKLELKSDIDLNALLDNGAPIKLKDNLDLDAFFNETQPETLAKTLKFSPTLENIKENSIKVLKDDNYVNNLMLNFDFSGVGLSDRMSHSYYVFGGINAYNNCIVYELEYTLFPKKAKVISFEEYKNKIAIIKEKGSGQLNILYDSTYDDVYHANFDKPELRDLGCGLFAVRRGIQINTGFPDMERELKRMYMDGNPLNPLMGRSSQNSGSIHYFTMASSHFALEDLPQSAIISGIINLTGENANANVITREQSKNLYGRIEDITKNTKFIAEVTNTLKQTLDRNGYDDTENKAQKLSEAFLYTLGHDRGFVNLLTGAQAVLGNIGQSEFDLYDLSLLEMLDD